MAFDGDAEELDIELLDHQADFAADMETPILVLEGGLGCGKTFAAMVKMLRLADAYPGVPGLVVEPTNDLIGTIFLATIDEFLTQWGVDYSFRTRWRGRPAVLLLWPGTPKQVPVYLRSGERPHRIAGFKVGWFIVDEADQQPALVWARCISRRRDKRIEKMGGVRQACAVYTPEPGYNWTWTRFHEKRTEKMVVVEGIPTSSNTFNPEGYDDELREAHDPDEVARVTTGKRSARDGLVYRRFSDENNTHVHPDPWAGDVEIWADFNNTKMAWCWVSLQGDRAWVFDELVREDTDTIQQAKEAAIWAALQLSLRRGQYTEEELRSRPPEMWPVTPHEAASRVTLIGDAAGDHDEGAAGKVSYELIRQQGFTVRHKVNNPLIDDTVLTVNAALLDGWLQFDKARAKYTTTCIRQQPYGPDGKPAKGKGSREKVKAGLDHGSDCIRYGTWFHRPVAHRRGNQRSAS